MQGFDPKFTTPEEYILGITHEIWEERQVHTLHEYYAPDIPVRSPAGVVIGNEAVIDATEATLAEFPDRQLYGEDVIWSDDGDGGFLSSHRILSTATHAATGAYGAASGILLKYRVIADCAARENTIYDEWLIRDQGAIVRQLGVDPRAYAEAQIEAEGGAGQASLPFHPDRDVEARYRGTGNDGAAGERYADALHGTMGGDGSLEALYDRAVQAELPGGSTANGRAEAGAWWAALRAAFPDAAFTIHHRIGRDDADLAPRAAVRWSLTGTHDGAGMFGDPTGTEIHVMGLSHAEFGPWGLRREFVLIDETAVWKQLLLATS